MRKLFESFRKYSLLTEDQLLVEGRKQDAAKKYPGLAKKREEHDGESLLDVLIDKDPSGNQKYLMRAAYLLQRSIEMAEQNDGYYPFYGKQWPEDADDNLYSPWGVANKIANQLSQYHKLTPWLRGSQEPYKDINNIDSYSQLQMVVQRALGAKEDAERKKEEQAALKKAAHEGSEVIANTPYHLVIRPLTTAASCYFGQQTRWCISATKSQNYFDQYTSEGKAFLFLLAKKKDVDPAYAKLAVVVDQYGEFNEYYDAEDDSLYLRMFKDAIRQTMIGAESSAQILGIEEDEPYEKEPIMDAAEDLDLMRLIDEDDEIETVVELINDTVNEYIDGLEQKGKESVQDTPAGTPDEVYEEKLAEYENAGSFENVSVELLFPTDTGVETTQWEAHVGVDLDDLLERAEGWEATAAWGEYVEREADELRDLVDTMMNEVSVWPEEVEQHWGDPTVFNVILGSGGGAVDSFENWLDDLNYEDGKISDGLLDAFIELASEIDPPLIRNPAKEAEEAEAARQKTRDAEYWPDPDEKKKQLELPLQENKRKIRILLKY